MIFLKTNVWRTVTVNSLLCLVIAVFTVSTANAYAPRELFCTIQSLNSFVDGSLVRDKRMLEYRYGDASTKSFVVNRLTGKIAGKAVSNELLAVQLVDNGAKKGQSVKIFSTVQPHIAANGFMHTQYLEILLYVEGRQKPFLLIDNGQVISGTCE